MTSNITDLQRAARFAFLPGYPFEIRNKGAGTRMACGGTSARALLPGTAGADGTTIVVYNPNEFDVYVGFGGSTDVATTSFYPIKGGDKEPLTVDPDATYILVITDGSTGTVFAHRGGGT